MLVLDDGPIHLRIAAFGSTREVELAYSQAKNAMIGLLPALAAELSELRKPIAGPGKFEGPVARRMAVATGPFSDQLITPMAAVAGAVADHVLDQLCAGRRLEKAYVNNGGDIALYLREDCRMRLAMVDNIAAPAVDGLIEIDGKTEVRGVATSGWRGRSFSLGIADAVTVLARNAGLADAAATMIANSVNADDPAIKRAPAESIDPDSDLRERLITTDVGPIGSETIARALSSGVDLARKYQAKGLIIAARLTLGDQSKIIGSYGLI